MSASLVVVSTVEEAVGELASGARAVAGGTDLVVGARQGKAPLPERLVAIHRLEELRAVQEANGVGRIGALAPPAELPAPSPLRGRFTALPRAAPLCAPPPTRRPPALPGQGGGRSAASLGRLGRAPLRLGSALGRGRRPPRRPRTADRRAGRAARVRRGTAPPGGNGQLLSAARVPQADGDRRRRRHRR